MGSEFIHNLFFYLIFVKKHARENCSKKKKALRIRVNVPLLLLTNDKKKLKKNILQRVVHLKYEQFGIVSFTIDTLIY